MKTLIDSHMVNIEEKFAAMEDKIAEKQQTDNKNTTFAEAVKQNVDESLLGKKTRSSTTNSH